MLLQSDIDNYPSNPTPSQAEKTPPGQVLLRDLLENDLFSFQNSKIPQRYRGNGWYGGNYDGGPYHAEGNPTVDLFL